MSTINRRKLLGSAAVGAVSAVIMPGLLSGPAQRPCCLPTTEWLQRQSCAAFEKSGNIAG